MGSDREGSGKFSVIPHPNKHSPWKQGKGIVDAGIGGMRHECEGGEGERGQGQQR